VGFTLDFGHDYRSRPSGHDALSDFPGGRSSDEGRTAVGLGIDSLSVDPGLSKDFPVRQYALAHSVYELENVANLERAPASGGMVVVAPTKLKSGFSGPVRILALVR
jgi:kynurenine formamidase